MATDPAMPTADEPRSRRDTGAHADEDPPEPGARALPVTGDRDAAPPPSVNHRTTPGAPAVLATGDGEAAASSSDERRTTLAIGVLLVAVGIGVLLVRQLGLDIGRAGWPLFVIVPGLALFGLAFAIGGRPGTGFAVAGAVTTVTGLILAAQNATGLWATWAYAWPLVAPGAAGLGLFLYGTFTAQREIALAGGWALLVGLVLFLAFAFVFEAVIGLSGDRIAGLDTLLALAFVALGAGIVAYSTRRGRRPA